MGSSFKLCAHSKLIISYHPTPPTPPSNFHPISFLFDFVCTRQPTNICPFVPGISISWTTTSSTSSTNAIKNLCVNTHKQPSPTSIGKLFRSITKLPHLDVRKTGHQKLHHHLGVNTCTVSVNFFFLSNNFNFVCCNNKQSSFCANPNNPIEWIFFVVSSTFINVFVKETTRKKHATTKTESYVPANVINLWYCDFQILIKNISHKRFFYGRSCRSMRPFARFILSFSRLLYCHLCIEIQKLPWVLSKAFTIIYEFKS